MHTLTSKALSIFLIAPLKFFYRLSLILDKYMYIFVSLYFVIDFNELATAQEVKQ